MSSDIGAVKFNDGLVMWFEYNGTSDICVPHLQDNPNFVYNKPWLECNCDNDESVEIMTYYGGGMYWLGKACRHCRSITDKLEPYGYDDGWSYNKESKPEWLINKVPDWATKAMDNFNKCGYSSNFKREIKE
jgi:hypothetical protein